MDRLDIERQLQRHEQQTNPNNNKKQQLIFYKFNTNNSHVFIKALFLLLLSISGGFTSKTLGCGTQKAFQNITSRHIILFALIYFTLDISDDDDKTGPLHPYEQLKQSVIMYICFILFTKMNFFFTMGSFALLCASYILGNHIKHIDWYIQNLKDKKKKDEDDANKINEYEILNAQSKKYQTYANYISVGILIVGSLSYLLKKKKEYGSRFSYITFFQGVSNCEGL
jgi:uncharacterized membrane protein SpoIIM required for sporulation